MLYKFLTYPGYGVFGNPYLNAVYAVTVLFTIVQIWLAGKQQWWQGLILPILYWCVTVPFVKKHFLTVGGILIGKDYHSMYTFLFPGLWLVMIYFIFYYYSKYKEAEKRKA